MELFPGGVLAIDLTVEVELQDLSGSGARDLKLHQVSIRTFECHGPGVVPWELALA